MRVDQAKRLKELEKENVRLKRFVADQALDNAILKDVGRETSKPKQATASRGDGLRATSSLAAARLPGAWASPHDPALPEANSAR